MDQKELYCLSTKLIDDPVVDHDDPVVDHDPVVYHDPVVGQLVVDAEAVDDDAVDGVADQLVEMERVGQLVEFVFVGHLVDVAYVGHLVDLVEL
jgi:hypothetical protein